MCYAAIAMPPRQNASPAPPPPPTPPPKLASTESFFATWDLVTAKTHALKPCPTEQADDVHTA